MIKININEEKVLKIKDLFRKWFYRKGILEEFYEVIQSDSKLKDIIFNSSEKEQYMEQIIKLTSKENKDEKLIKCKSILEDFFFCRFKYNKQTKSYGSEYVIKSKDILSDKTKDFFKNKYKNFRDSQGAKLIRILDIHVCPYCNRNYLELYSCKDKENKIHRYFKGELDHYYSKSIYPHLSLCIFNLIPSCKVCNHEKLDKDVQVIYPYRIESNDLCKFEISTLTLEDNIDIVFEEEEEDIGKKINDFTYLQGISDNFKVELKPIDKNYESIVNSSIDSFRLNKKYNNSKYYIKELLRKRYIYNDSYVKGIYKNFKTIFSSIDDIKKTLFSNELDSSDFNIRPLAKLTYDILNEIDYSDSSSNIIIFNEKADILIKQLNKKIGDIPDEYKKKLNEADEDIIEKIALNIFEIKNIYDLDNFI